MGYLSALAGGVLAGLISTGIYEVLKCLIDKWVLHFNPLDCRLVKPLKHPSVKGGAPISLFFYMRNKTKQSMPVYVSVRNTPLNGFQFLGIQWMGRSGVFSTRDITLEPGEGGTFVFGCSIEAPGCYPLSLTLDARPMGSQVKGKLYRLSEVKVNIE